MQQGIKQSSTRNLPKLCEVLNNYSLLFKDCLWLIALLKMLFFWLLLHINPFKDTHETIKSMGLILMEALLMFIQQIYK